MASIWTGAIAFGLVNIPVRVETAVRSHDLGFKLLAPKGKDSYCPVKYERVCKDDGKEVPWDDIVKGFEYEKERFVVLTDEDFDKAALATNKTFEIQDFAPEGEVDPRYFEKPYYLIPQKGGERAYALLRDAMKNTGTLGIGTITLRKKQYLASIKAIDDAIVLDLMRFADEVLDGSEYRFPGADYRPQELQMAEQLIGSLTEEFSPEKYRDEYRDNLEKIIAAKMKGKKVTLKESAEPEMTGVIDLMDRLKESLEGKPKKSTSTAKKKKSSTAASKRKSA
ncbi:MAG TPA: Ku protein [Longimicrobiaceae bacterium]|jgi:DNA end-binding protein Ku